MNRFNAAARLCRDGRMDEAADIFCAIVAGCPDHHPSLCGLGVIAQRQGRLDEAAAYFARALSAKPDFAEAHNNLGIVLQAQGHPEAAMDHFERAVAARPAYVDALENLAIAYFVQRRFEAAIAVWRRVLETTSDRRGTEVCVVKALYGYALVDREGARALASSVGADYPDRPILCHGVAGILGETTSRHNLDYVEALFDFFAGHFDVALAALDYSPKPVVDLLVDVVRPDGPAHDILDIGCGTGLCGEFLRPLARTLTGCDLSPRMIGKARQRGGYDRLEVAELVGFMEANPGRFDMVVAADVLIYCGDLEPAMGAARVALRPGGSFAFSVQTLDDAPGGRFALRPSGHYKHSAGYVMTAVAGAGLRALRAEAGSLRLEEDAPVPGLTVVARKPPD